MAVLLMRPATLAPGTIGLPGAMDLYMNGRQSRLGRYNGLFSFSSSSFMSTDNITERVFGTLMLSSPPRTEH